MLLITSSWLCNVKVCYCYSLDSLDMALTCVWQNAVRSSSLWDWESDNIFVMFCSASWDVWESIHCKHGRGQNWLLAYQLSLTRCKNWCINGSDSQGVLSQNIWKIWLFFQNLVEINVIMSHIFLQNWSFVWFNLSDTSIPIKYVWFNLSDASIPANCPDFGGAVCFFDVSDSKKLACPVFLKF